MNIYNDCRSKGSENDNQFLKIKILPSIKLVRRVPVGEGILNSDEVSTVKQDLV